MERLHRFALRARRLRGAPVVAVLATVCLASAAHEARAMGSAAHKRATAYTLGVLRRLDLASFEKLAAAGGRCADMQSMRARPATFAAMHWTGRLEEETAEVDNYRDLEFVDVEGGIGSGGRDDPHRDETWAIDDKAHYSEGSRGFTAFNHFIDIRKGPGFFDDYDGYSYRKGSGCRGEFQSATDAASSTAEWIAGVLTRYKVDEGVMGYWFNDEYVHAPCHSWYRNCSPSVVRYSFPGDKGIYRDAVAEAAARFPVANATGASGKGIPYSVFLPVDNMARYWFGRFVATRDILCLAPVLHAVQDACIPHHAAGCLGNWHGAYESRIDDARIVGWFSPSAAQIEAKDLVERWMRPDPSPPRFLAASDYGRTPAINWPVEQLVTWLAINAYREYSVTYGGFRSNLFNEESAHRLTRYAVAIGALILKKAADAI